MQIALLGPLAVRDRAGAPVDVGGRRARTLLTLLALRAGQVVTSAYLIDRIWDADPPDGAQNALQALVSRLRRHLPDGVLESHRAGYRLAVEPDAVDVCRFERLVAEGSAALASDPQRAATALDEALALWRGPALAETAEAGFAPAEVMRLDELRLTAIEDRGAAALRLGDGLRVVPELEALLATHPTRERAAGLLIRALAAAGRSGDALATYERTRAALADRLGADPAPELAALYRRLLRGDPRLSRSPAAPAEPPRSNLRAGLTSFVGRDDDLARVGKLVTEYRLTTLIGPGGSGKTRLAVEAARPLVDEIPDGVWLIELAPFTDGGEIAPAILTALGLRPQALLPGRQRVTAAERWGRSLDALERHLDAGDDPVDRLAAALAGRHLLLLLDNCEHLLDATAALTDRLLGECPRLRILTTSREPLGITGETLWPVEPLAMPPDGVSASQAASYPAVRLLAERAAAVRPGFAVDDRTVADVVRICRALDGLPLAIELAAARLRTMTPRQLADRLADRFRVLTGGSRTALPRHQTLQAVVDWSWELLSDPERRLLRRLAWFAGGATLEAVEQVCADDDLPADRVLDLLTALVDKSLVGACGGGHPRYELLETIRAYGLARLAEAGEVDAVRRAHAGYFLRLAATAEPQLRTGEQLRSLARLGEDHENLLAAVRGSIDAGDAPAAIGLAAALGWYWWLGGRKLEATEIAAEALALPADGVDREIRAIAYAMAALNAIEGPNDEARAVEWFQAATALAEHTDRRHPLLRLVGPISGLLNSWAWGSGGDELLPHAYPALTALLDDPDPWVRATARMTRGHAALNGGWNHAAAEEDLAAGLADYQTTGDRWGMAFMLSSLADLAAWRGEFAAAVAQLERAKELLAEFSTSEDLVTIRLRLALLRWLLGDAARAGAELAAARRQADRAGLAKGLLEVEHLAGDLARLTGELATARGHFATAVSQAAAQPTPPHFRAILAGSRGLLAGAEADLDTARTRHREALHDAIVSGDAPVIGRVLVGLADLALRDSEPRLAARLLGASVAVRGTEDKSLVDAERVAAAARAALGEPEFTEAYADGRVIDSTGEAVSELVAPLRLTPSA